MLSSLACSAFAEHPECFKVSPTSDSTFVSIGAGSVMSNLIMAEKRVAGLIGARLLRNEHGPA